MPPDEETGLDLIDDDNLRSIDRYVLGQIAPGPTRRQIINQAIRDWASRQGLRHPEPVEQDKEPRDAAAENSHDRVRFAAAGVADKAMQGMSASVEQKSERRRLLTDEPKVIAAAKQATDRAN